MIRSWIKTRAASFLSSTSMDKVAASLSGSSKVPLVLGYHRVVEDFAASAVDSIPSMLISRAMLEKHLDWIGKQFRFVCLDEVGARLDGSDASCDPIAAVTFDDGYRDFYEMAFPLLQRKGIPSAVFVVTDLVNTARAQLHDQLYLLLKWKFGLHGGKTEDIWEMLRGIGLPAPHTIARTPFEATRALLESLPQAGLQQVVCALESEASLSENTLRQFHSLTWDMIEKLHSAGVTIGSHTRTHVLLTKESEERITDEVAGSRREIEKRLGARVRHFVYPSGEFDQASIDAVAKAGYQFAYTGCSHRALVCPTLTVPRTLLWQNSCLDFRGDFSGHLLNCQIHRTFDVVSGCRQSHGLTLESSYAQ
jgi:peptidoglycan/xylan/chitin deacetylase (PgdA/CDA1 family)